MKYECNRISNWAAGGRQQCVLLPPIFISQEAACSTIPFNWVNHTNIDNSMDYPLLFKGLWSFLNFRSTPMLGQQQQQQQHQHNNNAASSAGIWANINFGRVAVRGVPEMPLFYSPSNSIDVHAVWQSERIIFNNKSNTKLTFNLNFKRNQTENLQAARTHKPATRWLMLVTGNQKLA